MLVLLSYRKEKVFGRKIRGRLRAFFEIQWGFAGILGGRKKEKIFSIPSA
jgi:hypothetical protein